ncbi:MAG: DUF362 domain-containing protein [Candidatus Lokiarchaeota archaeon]|nr:DUF362 domain-containing protein [Candidatus Lokiarchaeota archaeon]
MTANIAISKNDDQRAAVIAALGLVRDDVLAALDRWEQAGGQKRVLIKPNLLSTNTNLMCNTTVDACLGVADFFGEATTYKVLVGDGTTYESKHKPSTMVALENHGYAAHKEAWNMVDLHDDVTGRWFGIVNHEAARPVELGVAALAVESFVVSVAKMKTHDVLGMTLCLKNMMGTLNAARYRGEAAEIHHGDVKGYMHGFGNKKPHELARAQNVGPSKVALAANLVRLAACRLPDLAVVDGSTVMEGSGPRRGSACAGLGGFAMAGTDPVAVDATCAAIAGLPLDSFQYVLRAGERGLGTHGVANIACKGIGWQALECPLKRHPLFAEAAPWKQAELDELEGYLAL